MSDELPESDREFLKQKDCRYTVEKVGGFIHVIVHDFDLSAAYTPRKADMLVRLPSGYPNGNPDMFWTRPKVKLADGRTPINADVSQDFDGVIWQRWSRHYPDGRWRVGVDGLDTYLASVRRELALGR
jgi:hypothetical protein